MTEFADISASFKLEGDYHSCSPHGSGHIHDTYLLTVRRDKRQTRYILQRLNTHVFRKPEALQDNLRRILEYLHDPSNKHASGIVFPEPVLTPSGNNYSMDHEGNYWRCFRYIEYSRVYDRVETPEQAFEGSRLFGIFNAALKGYNPRRLHITIPDFLDIEVRLRQLMIAQLANPAGRLKHASGEFNRLLEHQLISRDFTRMRLALPDRVVHNDTKISNILFHKRTGRGISVIDLDTVMTGTLLTDFGDMIRTFTAETPEDDRDLESTRCNPGLFEAVYAGFMESVGDFISGVEHANLLLGAKLMIYMQAVRFLTDYLNGDVYYRIAYPFQNLDRAKNQLVLLDSFLSQEGVFRDILKKKY
jgi:hypothetical protein